ncbi:MAG TPA: hypothetical protein VLI90_09645 [Tepidisphaeraceae bacterium]|nr:hypothetical protein [Tepidisphaeraceae bacterium]
MSADGLRSPRCSEARRSSYLIDDALVRASSAGLRNIATIKVRVYQHLITEVSADQIITPQERHVMAMTREMLRLSDADVGSLEQELNRREVIWSIQRGELPTINSPVALQKNEVARFAFYGVEFHQERVVSRKCVGSSEGYSIRIAKGVTYRAGSHRGRYVNRTALVPVGIGQLVLTSKRLIFAGTSGFSVPFIKILQLTAYADGFAITKDSTAKSNVPFVFICPDPELTILATTACINGT